MTPEKLQECERSPVPFHVIINPRLTILNNAVIDHFEGCLSVGNADLGALVSRVRTVRVDCLNHLGEEVILNAQGWYARILQHEIDHLRGMLFVDRMEPRSLTTRSNLTRFWQDKSIHQIRSDLEPQTQP